MKKSPSLAHQRKRPRFKSKNPVGVPRPNGSTTEGAYDDAEDSETPSTMEARTQEAEAAYQFSGDEPDTSTPPPSSREREAESHSADGTSDPAALRREQERQRRDQERDRRENERKERDRRENERRDQQKKELERRDRERMQEMRSLNMDSICERAWEIYSAEVKEEGVELFPDNDARELCKRSFRLAEIFLLEEARLRKLRAEPLPPETAPDPTSETPAEEPTMGE